jgi:hypothetical protein
MNISKVGQMPSIADAAFDGSSVTPTPHQIAGVAYRTGAALKGHCDSAHKGAFDPNCRACRELKAKQTS